eukprot:tig00000073_g1714.t1
MAEERLVWVDCEMSGLDLTKDYLLEIAVIVTDSNLNVIAESPEITIHASDELLDGMNDWCKKHHGESGLTQRCRDSKISMKEAESMVLEFVRKNCPEGKCPLAGNSVHADKEFLRKDMPSFLKYLHYRIVDVSTIKELCRRWAPETFKKAPPKSGAHRALQDIKESIEELHFYKKHLFNL